MSNRDKPLKKTYRTQEQKRGYQPQVPASPNKPKPQNGYTPTGSGDKPSNPPQPPDEE